MLPKILIQLLLSLFTTLAFAQYTLSTPDGKKVKLEPNGTWTFITKDSARSTKTGIPAKSTARYTSRFKKFEIWYNPEEFSVDSSRKENTYTWDAHFFSTDFALDGYCLESRLTVPLENLESYITQQWQSGGTVKSFTNHNDTINNLPVVIFELEYVQHAISYVYKGFIHSSPKGSFQFSIGTQKEVYEEDKNKIDILFSGFRRK